MRNKLVTTFAGLSILVFIGAFIAVSIALYQARVTQIKSDIEFDEFRTGVDRFFTLVSEETLLDQPGMQNLRKELLNEALLFYEKFVNSERNTPQMENELGNAYYRLGYIQEHLGSLDEGVEAYRKAVRLQKQLLAKSADSPEVMEDLGRTLNAHARILHKRNQLDEAADLYLEAIACRADLTKSAPENDVYRRHYANTIMNLGLVQRDLKEFQSAEKQFKTAHSLRQGFETLGINFRRDLARGSYNWGDLRSAEKRWDDAVRFFEESALFLESILAENPRSLEDRYSLALCRRKQGDAASQQRSFKQATKSHEQALESLNVLLIANPDVPEYLEEYANIELQLGYLAHYQGQLDRAEELFTDAKQKFAELVAKSSQNFNYRFAYLIAMKELELTLAARTDLEDRSSETLVLLQEVQQGLRELKTEFPDRTEVDAQLVDVNKFIDALKASIPKQPSQVDF